MLKFKPANWSKHPDVRSDDELSLGERVADRMKAVMATFTALFAVLAFIAIWIRSNGFGADLQPWIMLNLFLSCFAALQCFILLISAKRGERLAYEVSMSTLDRVKALESQHGAMADKLELMANLQVADSARLTEDVIGQLTRALRSGSGKHR